jgi:hypothetical protein
MYVSFRDPPRTFQNAQAYCEESGGVLFTIQNSADLTFLQSVYASNPKQFYVIFVY